jgi:hypothetical protein
MWAAVSAPAWSRDATVRGQAVQQVVECGRSEPRLEGNGNQIAFRENCRSLVLRGNGNEVDIQVAPGAPLRVEGRGNEVVYHAGPGAPPVPSTAGRGNSLTAGQPTER